MGYEDSEWTSRYNGAHLPTVPGLDLHGMYEGRLADWANIKMDRSRCMFYLPDGKRVLFQTVLRELKRTFDPVVSLAPYVTLPNGQVKNFLNACVAASSVKTDSIRVLVVGSKSGESSGLWHRLFAIWLSMRFSLVVIDFFDPAELSATWSLDLGDSQISCEWIPSMINVAELLPGSYDVLVDDVWSLEGHSLPYTAEFLASLKSYSLKQILSTEQRKKLVKGSLFLHRNERRLFKPARIVQDMPGCRCMTCEVIKSCTSDYEDYKFLRHLVGRLGFSAPCEGIDHLHELAIVADLMKRLRSGLKVEGANLARYVTALTEEIGVVQMGEGKTATYHHKGEPRFKVFRRFDETVYQLPSYPFLEDKEVAFLGVPSTVVGRTRLRASHYDFEHGSVFFVNSLETWKLLGAAQSVFTMAQADQVSQSFPGWVLSGNRVNGYKEWVLRPREKIEKVVIKPEKLSSVLDIKLKSMVGGVVPLDLIGKVPLPYSCSGLEGRKVLRHPTLGSVKKRWIVLTERGQAEISGEQQNGREPPSRLVDLTYDFTRKYDGGRGGTWSVTLEDENGERYYELPPHGVVFASVTGSYLKKQNTLKDQKGKSRPAQEQRVQEISQAGIPK